MRDGVQIGGDEFTPGIFTDAEGCVLDLVVVDVPVKTHYHGSYLGVGGRCSCVWRAGWSRYCHTRKHRLVSMALLGHRQRHGCVYNIAMA